MRPRRDNSNPELSWIAAIGEPTRLAILATLATGDKTVSELARACRSEFVNVSFHLLIMRKAGLVTREKVGRFKRYSLRGGTITMNQLVMTHESGIRVFLPLA